MGVISDIISSKKELGGVLFRFGIVGLSGVAVNMVILWYLTEILDIYYVLSSVVATEVSILTNFGFNELWTFDKFSENNKSLGTKALEFNIVYAFGLVINVAVLWIATEYFQIYYLIANCMGIIVAFVWNFFFSSRIVWEI